MPTARWTVLAHDPIDKIAENLWRVEGDLPGKLAPVRRTMVVVKLGDGRLVIHNAIALRDEQMAEIEAWGTPAWLIVPNGWHRIDARAYKERYPAMRVVCPSGAKKRVEKVVVVDETYDAKLGDTVTVRHLPGVRPQEGVMEVESKDGLTLVFTDLINNLPKGGFFYDLFAGTGRVRHHRMVTFMLARDRRALRAELERLAALPNLRRVLVAHGAPILTDAAAALRTVAAGL